MVFWQFFLIAYYALPAEAGLKRRNGPVLPVPLPVAPPPPAIAPPVVTATETIETVPPPLEAPPLHPAVQEVHAPSFDVQPIPIPPPLESPILAQIIPLPNQSFNNMPQSFYGKVNLSVPDAPQTPGDLGVSANGFLIPGEVALPSPLGYIAPFVEYVPQRPHAKMIPRQKVGESAMRGKSEARQRKALEEKGEAREDRHHHDKHHDERHHDEKHRDDKNREDKNREDKPRRKNHNDQLSDIVDEDAPFFGF